VGERPRVAHAPGAPDLWPAQLWLICSAWLTTVFFVLLSLRKPIVPTWPIPNMAPAAALVAQLAIEKLGGPTPDRRFRGWWRASLVYGSFAMLVLAFPTVLAHLPVYGPKLRQKVLARVSGHRERFEPLVPILRSVTDEAGRPPLPVARNYQEASLATFYLPGHPPVATRGNYTGVRPSNFDHWPETDLSDPRHHGRTLVLMLTGNDPRWEDIFEFERLRPAPQAAYLLAEGYRGPRRRPAPPPAIPAP
jgi:hypothetical protein